MVNLIELLTRILEKILVLSSVDESFKEILVGDYTLEAEDINPDLSGNSSDALWLTAAIKAICINYPNESNVVFKGRITPNSDGYFEVCIYDTSTLVSGLPQYCYGTWRKWQSTFAIISTNNSSSLTYTAK